MFKKNITRVLSSALVLSMALSLMSFGSYAAAEEESKGTIGVLMPTFNSEFFVTVSDSLEAHLQEAGYDTIAQSFENDGSEAVTCIENFITEGVDGIAYMTVDTSGDDALKEAMDAGIGVLICGVLTENYDIFEVADNYLNGQIIGQMAAEYIDENFDGSAQIAMVSSTKSEDMINRCNGIKDALAELSPDSEIVYEAECVNVGEGTAFVENLNTLYPDCQVIVSYSDTFGAEAAEEFNALNYPDTAAIFSEDGEEKILSSIASGGYNKGTVVTGDAGEQMAEGIINYLEGVEGYESGTTIVVPGIGVTPENVDEYYEAE